MKIEEIKEKLKSEEYDFLRTDTNLGNNIAILTLGGSHAYGIDIKGSDLDIRGCALNTKMQILTNENFEQFVNEKTDTTIYSFNKLISLLTNANPNVIEMLGNKPEHYFYLSPIGKELIDNTHLFLSKRAIYSFGGFINQTMRRLLKDLRLIENDETKDKFKNNIKLYLGKSMCHPIRLSMMCIDILEEEKVVTYREKNERDLLLDIRNGKYLNSNNKPIAEYYKMIHDYDKRLEYLKQHTNLPDSPNYKEINEFMASVNERVVRGL